MASSLQCLKNGPFFEHCLATSLLPSFSLQLPCFSPFLLPSSLPIPCSFPPCAFLQNLVRSPCSFPPSYCPLLSLPPSIHISLLLSLSPVSPPRFLPFIIPPFPPSFFPRNLIYHRTLLLVFFCSSFDKQFTQFFKSLF